MGLSAKEKKLLANLQKKAEEPDAPPVGKSISINLDLSNADQLKLAKQYGFLPADDVDDDDDDDGDEDADDDTPKRRGYFGDGAK